MAPLGVTPWFGRTALPTLTPRGMSERFDLGWPRAENLLLVRGAVA